MIIHQNNAKQFTMMQQICANGPLHLPGRMRNFGRIYLPKLTPNNCAIYNTPMITANQLLLSIPCFKCVAQLLDIFNNYLPLRYTTTPT
jgi:hypothetical protein